MSKSPGFSTTAQPSTPSNIPTKMRGWQYVSAAKGLENGITLKDDITIPTLAANDSLIKVQATSLNPVDYKIPEIPWPASAILKTPAIPACDFAGVLVKTTDPALEQFVGKRVMAHLKTFMQYGGCAEYCVVKGEADIMEVPANVSSIDASAFGTAALTAYQSIVIPLGSEANVRGKRIFVNGGSGGVGIFCIQIAKALGAAHVGVSCSTGNVKAVQDLGADGVIDYKEQDIGKVLKEEVAGDFDGKGYDLLVDNVGVPAPLYKQADFFLKKDGIFAQVAAAPKLSSIKETGQRALLPAMLGGGKRKWKFIGCEPNREHFTSIQKMMAEGEVKAVVAKVFDFGEVPDAYRLLKKGSGVGGKVVVEVSKE